MKIGRFLKSIKEKIRLCFSIMIFNFKEDYSATDLTTNDSIAYIHKNCKDRYYLVTSYRDMLFYSEDFNNLNDAIVALEKFKQTGVL